MALGEAYESKQADGDGCNEKMAQGWRVRYKALDVLRLTGAMAKPPCLPQKQICTAVEGILGVGL